MIELFDAARLATRRDHSPAICVGVLALGAATISVYAYALQQRLRGAEAQRVALQTQLENTQPKAQLNPALVADMQRQAEALEAQLKLTTAAATTALDGLRPSTWLERLGTLGSSELSLAKVELDRSGAARIEGLATTPAAVSAFVQAFAAQNRQAPLQARAIELRQEKAMAPYLRFVMRANPPPPAARTLPTAPPAAVDAAASAAAPNPLQVAANKP